MFSNDHGGSDDHTSIGYARNAVLGHLFGDAVMNHAPSDSLQEALDDALDQIDTLIAQVERVRVADAVARVWIVGLMQGDARVCAHPLSCVRAALDGETDPGQLGCRPEELEAALRTEGVEELRKVLGV